MTISSKQDKIPKTAFRDGTKWLLVPSKIILEAVCMWPENQNGVKKIVATFSFVCFAFALVGQVTYAIEQYNNLPKLATTLSLVFLSIEVMVRRFLNYLYSEQIQKILKEIYLEFWPSDAFGVDLHKELSKQSLHLALYFTTCIFFAFSRCLEGIILSFSDRSFPLFTKYSFSDTGPYYEVIFVLQAFLAVDSTFNICGFDFFVCSLILNCSSQFKLLRKFIENECLENATRDKKRLMVIIIKRHVKLISVCKELETVITMFVLIQYLASIGAVCLSSFVAAAVPEDLQNSLPFAFGHSFLIFGFCWMGENLNYESELLANTIYECNWHTWNEDQNLQKDIVILLVRSQKPITISMGGFSHLNFSSFMKSAQFVFSVFTFLNKMMNRQQDSKVP